jgi:hypothetical protein
MSVIHDQVFGARTPNYKVLQQLDRKVRDFYTPPSLQVPGFGGSMTDVDAVPVYLTLQRYVGFAIREMSESVVNLTQTYALAHTRQPYFTCIAVFLHVRLKTVLMTPLAASTRLLSWRYTTVHAPSLDWSEACFPNNLS